MKKLMSKSLIVSLIVVFLYEAENSLLSYVNSTHLSKNFDLAPEQIGLLFSGGSILALIVLFMTPRFIKQYGKHAVLITISLISALAVFMVSQLTIPLALITFIIFLAGNQIIWFIADLEVEDNTPTKKTGTTRGILFTVVNAAWLIFPALAAQMLGVNESSLSHLYTYAGIAMVAIALITFFGMKKEHITFKHETHNFSYEMLISFIKNSKRSLLFFCHVLLKVFYAVMIIYTPLYLRDVQHISWSQIDGIFFIMLLPFVLIEYPVGYLEDKFKNETSFLYAGFIILLVTLIVFLKIDSSSWVTWALILFGTRVGAALIEVSTESAFFKEVTKNEIEHISIYRSATALSFIVTPILASILIIAGGNMTYVFYIPIAISILGIYCVYKLSKDV